MPETGFTIVHARYGKRIYNRRFPGVRGSLSPADVPCPFRMEPWPNQNFTAWNSDPPSGAEIHIELLEDLPDDELEAAGWTRLR